LGIKIGPKTAEKELLDKTGDSRPVCIVLNIKASSIIMVQTTGEKLSMCNPFQYI
jgi:hypothetical protein